MFDIQEILMLFEKNILLCSHEKKISRPELCKKTGVSASHMSLIVNGKKNLTLGVACRIAVGLGVALSGLIGELPVKVGNITLNSERVAEHDTSGYSLFSDGVSHHDKSGGSARPKRRKAGGK